MTQSIMDYVPTPSLSDDKGKALLQELENLYFAIDFDPKTKKQRRRNSHDIRFAVAELQAALIKAAANFERHREFTRWLGANTRDHIEAYDPVRRALEVTNELHDLRWRVDMVEQDNRATRELLREIINERLKTKPAA